MTPDHCPACRALFAECGPELGPMYSKKLLQRGWAGRLSQAERAYVKAHRQVSDKQQEHIRKLAGYRFAKRPDQGEGAHPKPKAA